jgi:nucleotide-binding universal stress UspA family protein
MYQTIIAATDLSQTAQSAIDAAAALAGHFGAKLILLHIYQLPIVPFTDAALMPPTDYLGEVMRESDRRLEEMRPAPEATPTRSSPGPTS